MKTYIMLIALVLSSITLLSQNNMSSPMVDVTNDISARQYMDIKLFVLKHGQVSSYSDVSNAVEYSFDNVDIYLTPCNLDPMVAVDTIMPEQNYCDLVFKINFVSPLYNSFFQYITLKLIGNQVFIAPVFDDLHPNFRLQREDIIDIVQNIINQIGTSYEY